MNRGSRRLTVWRRAAFVVGGSTFGGGGVVLGIRVVGYGVFGGHVVALVVGALDALAGYVALRRTFELTLDAILAGALAVVVLTSWFITTQIQLPPSVFQLLGR